MGASKKKKNPHKMLKNETDNTNEHDENLRTLMKFIRIKEVIIIYKFKQFKIYT